MAKKTKATVEKGKKLTVYEVITERFLEFIEKNERLPWVKPWGMPSNSLVQKNFASGHEYRGVNTLLTTMSGFDSNLWITEKQAKAKGGRIKADEFLKGTPIVFWTSFAKKKKEEEEKEELTKTEEKEKEEEKETTTKKFKRYGYHRFYTVYNMEQTEGIKYDMPTPPPTETETTKEQEAVNELIDKAEQVIAEMPNRPTLNTRGIEAYYAPLSDEVVVPPLKAFKTSEGYYSTLFHELAHSTGHKSRLNRAFGASFGTKDYSKEELIAEIASAFVLNTLEINTDDTERNSKAYVQHWLQKLSDNPEWIVSSANASERASDYILGRLM